MTITCQKCQFLERRSEDIIPNDGKDSENKKARKSCLERGFDFMRTLRFFSIASLAFLWTISVQAQSTSPFNLHIGGGVGAGPNLGPHSSIVGEFMWQGLPPTRNTLLPVVNALCATTVISSSAACSIGSISGSNNLYALTANYVYHVNGRLYGAYVIGGGGWYYRYAQLHNATVAPGTVCQPAWDWWGYTCQNGFVSTTNVLATKGLSSGGVNAGIGFTIRLGPGDSNVKYYIEARYHYSPQGGQIATHILPVTMGLRW
jgi:hypothetical protein